MRFSAGVAVVVAVLLLTGAAGAATFTDPVGDTKGPDIASVAITTSASDLKVDVHVANRTALEAEEVVEINLDLDNNPSTGQDGVDLYGLVQADAPPEVAIWQNDDFVDTTRARASFTSTGAHLTAQLALLRGTTVKVSTAAIGAFDPDGEELEPPEDDAPDTGAYTFTVVIPALRSSSVGFSPAKPVAGKRFRVKAVSLTFGGEVGTVKPTYTCSATLAGKKLAKGCSWLLPRSAAGKKLRVSIVASFEGRRFTLPARTFVVG